MLDLMKLVIINIKTMSKNHRFLSRCKNNVFTKFLDLDTDNPMGYGDIYYKFNEELKC